MSEKLLTTHNDIFIVKLNKIKSRINKEITKTKRDRDTAALRKMLEEAKKVKKVIRKLEEQIREETGGSSLFVLNQCGLTNNLGSSIKGSESLNCIINNC